MNNVATLQAKTDAAQTEVDAAKTSDARIVALRKLVMASTASLAAAEKQKAAMVTFTKAILKTISDGQVKISEEKVKVATALLRKTSSHVEAAEKKASLRRPGSRDSK